MVGHGYDFRLKLHPGKWKEGKSGTIRITFRNVMHTVSDEEFPFYRTIDLQMVSETKSYTTAGEPLFYLYPLRFDNRLYYKEIGETKQSVGRLENVADAEDICRNIGDGWLCLLPVNCCCHSLMKMLWVAMQRIIIIMIARIYMGGIKTGPVITGLHHTMRLKALLPVFGGDVGRFFGFRIY